MINPTNPPNSFSTPYQAYTVSINACILTSQAQERSAKEFYKCSELELYIFIGNIISI